jgi:branched-chain amino acid transport system permease protein
VIEALLQTLLNGAASGGVYALVALGYTLIFSVLGVINFAQGALFSLGGYLTYLLLGGKIGVNGALPGWGLPGGLPFWLALMLAALGSGLVGLLVERIAFAPLRRRGAEPLLSLITSLGAGVVLVNLLQILMGAEGYAFPQGAATLAQLPESLLIGGARIRSIQVLLLLISALAVAALSLWLERSRSGKAMRAVAEDATTATLLGINSEAIVRLAFLLSGMLAGLGGGLIGMSVSLAGPYFGISYGLKGLAVLVLGGLGSVPGAIVGGLVMGLAEALIPAAASGWRDALAFAILFAVLVLRPSGLLGRRQLEKV